MQREPRGVLGRDAHRLAREVTSEVLSGALAGAFAVVALLAACAPAFNPFQLPEQANDEQASGEQGGNVEASGSRAEEITVTSSRREGAGDIRTLQRAPVTRGATTTRAAAAASGAPALGVQPLDEGFVVASGFPGRQAQSAARGIALARVQPGEEVWVIALSDAARSTDVEDSTPGSGTMLAVFADAAEPTSYVIGPGDVLQVVVSEHADLATVVQVRPDGRISTPLVEDLEAVGKSFTQLAGDIEAVLAQYVRSPRVTVMSAGGTERQRRYEAPAREIPLPLKHTDVRAVVSGYVGTVNVTQQFTNPYDEKIEAVYLFPLPEKAAVSEFVMTIGERQIRGILREKEEAEAVYLEARAQGYRASLLTQHRPNIFEQKVANIEPGKQIDVNIRYFHTLAYEDGWYSFVFPTVVGPRYNPQDSSDPVARAAARRTSRPAVGAAVRYLRPNERSAHDIERRGGP